MIDILAPGPLTTIQDLGRPGLAALGVGESGAADRRSLTLANRLVGNPEDVAGLELTYGGLAVRFTCAAVFALTGAPCALQLDSRAVDMYSPVYAAAGQRLVVGSPATGLRTYLAVRGGIDVPPVLGARATDILAGLGPARLKSGQTVPIGSSLLPWPSVDFAPQRPYLPEPVLHVIPGPRDDWFTPHAITHLTSTPYEVTAESNRIGIRLRGPRLLRRNTGELPPEATVRGALQVPPDGQPVLFLADHPVTGGYPVVGVVAENDLHLAAQARPGQHVRFRLAPERNTPSPATEPVLETAFTSVDNVDETHPERPPGPTHFPKRRLTRLRPSRA